MQLRHSAAHMFRGDLQASLKIKHMKKTKAGRPGKPFFAHHTWLVTSSMCLIANYSNQDKGFGKHHRRNSPVPGILANIVCAFSALQEKSTFNDGLLEVFLAGQQKLKKKLSKIFHHPESFETYSKVTKTGGELQKIRTNNPLGIAFNAQKQDI